MAGPLGEMFDHGVYGALSLAYSLLTNLRLRCN